MNIEKLLSLMDTEDQIDMLNYLLDSKMSKIDKQDRKDLVLESIPYIWDANKDNDYSLFIEDFNESSNKDYDEPYTNKELIDIITDNEEKLLFPALNELYPGVVLLRPLNLNGELKIDQIKTSFDIEKI